MTGFNDSAEDLYGKISPHISLSRRATGLDSNISARPARTLIWAALFAVYFFWGSTYLAIRFAVATIPPFLMAGTRFMIAGSILFIWRFLAKDPLPTKVEWRDAAIVGLIMLSAGNGCLSWAEQSVPSGVTALIVGSAPIWMVALDMIRPGGRRPGWLAGLGILLGFGGIVILIGPESIANNTSSLNLPAVGLVLASAFLWAIGSLYNRSAKLPRSPLLGIGMEMLAGGGGLLLAATIHGDWTHLNIAAISAKSLAGLAYLIFFGSLVGFVSYMWLLRNVPTPLAATYAYVNPIIAIFLGNLLAGELLTARILLSTLIVVGSVVLINFFTPSSS